MTHQSQVQVRRITPWSTRWGRRLQAEAAVSLDIVGLITSRTLQPSRFLDSRAQPAVSQCRCPRTGGTFRAAHGQVQRGWMTHLGRVRALEGSVSLCHGWRVSMGKERLHSLVLDVKNE